MVILPKKAIFLFESSKSPRPPQIAIRPIKTLRKFRFWNFLSNQIVFNLFRNGSESPQTRYSHQYRVFNKQIRTSQRPVSRFPSALVQSQGVFCSPHEKLLKVRPSHRIFRVFPITPESRVQICRVGAEAQSRCLLWTRPFGWKSNCIVVFSPQIYFIASDRSGQSRDGIWNVATKYVFGNKTDSTPVWKYKTTISAAKISAIVKSWFRISVFRKCRS